jgi:holliday junction DNA helicase RuvA
MIVYLKGKLTDINPTSAIVETSSGIGYKVQITLSTYNKIKTLNKEIKLLTHFIVKEDSQTLYGFADEDERHIFTQLISVSGVGPSTARLLLSTLSAQDVRHAIISENIDTLKSAKGIGPKASKRIVLELKDKILKDGGVNSSVVAQALTINNIIREEALSALIALGFNKSLVQKTLNRVLKEKPDLSDSGELIKQALGQLSS